MLPDGQPPTVAFTVHAQLWGPKPNETEMVAALITKNGEGKTLTSDPKHRRVGVMIRTPPVTLKVFDSVPSSFHSLHVLNLSIQQQMGK